MITLEEIIKATNLHPTRIQNVYVFGSRIYGTASDKSDYDILLIANTPYPEKELVVDNLNIHILVLDRFLEQLKQHHIGKIECVLSPFILKNSVEISLDIKIPSLRHSISHTCSNSWVKCKKKLEQGDYYIGIKSLFHSLRIAMFGIQLAEHGKIIDWTCANYIWDKLQSKQWTWEELDKEFRAERNKILTEFRKITEK
jgi:predicted nucleotidyltransferase